MCLLLLARFLSGRLPRSCSHPGRRRCRSRLHGRLSAEESLSSAGNGYRLARSIVISVLNGRLLTTDSRHPEVVDVDDSLAGSHSLEEVQHREVWSVDFQIERDFGVVLLWDNRFGQVVANLHAGLL